MKLISFRHIGRQSYGFIDDDHRVIDLGAAPNAPADLKSAFAQGVIDTLIKHATSRLELNEVELLPVIPNPAKIFCVGHNYESHRQETGRAKVDYPSIFTRFADTLTAHDTPIIRPTVSETLDFEGELALIIGKPGRHILEAEALSYVAGYAPFNDASVREWQWHTQQFIPGKNFPHTGGFGPWMITADELPDPGATSVTTRLNGQVVQSQSTSDMIFSVPVIIAYLSTFTQLSPGDVICSGTPGGVGAKRTPPLWMKPGDVVEVDIPGVGLLRNTIVLEGADEP
jgi:2-keto-4-pentenoate hydratase/2-oxohepta-3-ene-1,7-dioic acid hydratase in catechol pathway